MAVEVVVARADAVDRETFAHIRAALPEQRRKRSDAYYRETDRYASAVSFALLQFLWAERFDSPLPPVARGKHNKPHLVSGRRVEFNLSHDASICVCVLHVDAVGIDVQSRVPFDEDLFARISAPSEKHQRDRYVREDDLSLIWSRKEAIVKRSGEGLRATLRDTDTMAEPELVTIRPRELEAYISLSAPSVTVETFRDRVRVRQLTAQPKGEWRASPLLFELCGEARHFSIETP